MKLIIATLFILSSAFAPSSAQTDGQTKPPAAPPEKKTSAPSTDISATPLLGEKDPASALAIISPLCPDGRFQFVTCEAVLEKDRDLGVFVVKPGGSDWKFEQGEWHYTWTLGTEMRVTFHAKAEHDGVLLRYELENIGDHPLERVQLHPCLQTLGAPNFYPGTAEQAHTGSTGRAARIGVHDFRELWSRLFLWSAGKKFAFDSSAAAKTEKHLSFERKGARPTKWSWWVDAPETFDVPLIVAVSKDGKSSLALGFDAASWASSNSDDSRGCFHMFPSFGDMKPGEKRSVSGHLYVISGGADQTLERFKKDHPKAIKE